MKKILMIGMSPNPGGIETFIMNIYRNINKQNFKIEFLNVHDKPIAYEKEIKESGGVIHSIKSRRTNYLGNQLDLIRFYKKNNFDIIHCHIMNNCYPYPLIYAPKKSKICVHSHTAGISNNYRIKFFHKLYKPLTVRFSDNLFACSQSAGEFMYGNSDFKIINNAIDMYEFSFCENKRESIRGQLDLKGLFVMGHIGSFSEVKNHEFLIDVFSSFVKKKENAHLLLVGEGSLKSKIKDKVMKYGLENKVSFIGNRNDVDAILCAIDIILLPSHFEGLPYIIVEAQASGLNCIISNNISQEVAITNQVEFLPISEQDIEIWIKKISIIMEQKNTSRPNMLVETKYDLKNVISVFENEYYK